VIDDLHRKIGQLQVERDFLTGQPAISRLLRGATIVPKAELSISRQCTLLEVASSRLLLPAVAQVCKGTRFSRAARPHFHRPTGLRQPPAAGGAAAGAFDRPSTHPAANEKAGTVRG
jgi:hypothetical protein